MPELPRVRLTEVLRSNLEFDPDAFCTYFAEWKATGEAGEYADAFFGKDGQYDRPRRDGRRVLHHVHLPPASGTRARALWDREAARPVPGRKTSDVVLIYSHDRVEGYLLLSIVKDPPGAHAATDMRNPEARKFMEALADVAEVFLHDGRILI